MSASVIDMSSYRPIAPRPSTRTIYEIREIAELFGRRALSPADLPRLDQHYAAVTYGEPGITYAHPDLYPVAGE